MRGRERGLPEGWPVREVTASLHEAVVTQVPEAIVATDTEGIVRLWNPAAERLFGYPARETVGAFLPTLLPETWRTGFVSRVLAGERVSETVLRPRRDGTMVEVFADYSPLLLDGEVRAVVAVFHDVTEQRSQERDLRARTELTERLHSLVVDLNSDLDLPTLLWRISKSGVELLRGRGAGYVLLDGDELSVAAVSRLPDELVGRTFPYLASAVAALIESGRSSMVDDAAHYANVARVVSEHVEGLSRLAVARTVVHGELTGALYVFFDDPGRVVTQSELYVLELLAGHAGTALANAQAYGEAVRQREHERAVVEAMADGMAVIDSAGTVLEWNPAAEAMTGLPSRHILGHPVPFPLPDLNGTALDHELPGGRWIEILVTPIAGSEQRVVDFRDITGPKMLEEAKDLFLATTSHELRTPITVMKGFAETLLHRWDMLSPTARKEAVSVIVERTQALAALVEQLLLGTRAGAGALTLSPMPMDVEPVLRQAVAAFGHFSESHRVRLRVDERLPRVLADRVAFDNVIGQLLENAFKYSPDGGVVTIEAVASGDDVSISVEDEGIGIDPEVADRVFERFYQGDTGNRRRFGGVGLGLYIVRQLVEAQGGRVAVVPRDHGACVELRLPALPAAESPA